MKQIAFLTMLVTVLLAASCTEEHVQQVDALVPVYGTLDDLSSMIRSTDPIQLSEPGKIYVKDNYLFINEVLKGIHVYDNADPENPEALAFIQIPGNLDVAMKGNYLYADYNNGLATIDLSDVFHAKLTDFNSDYNSRDNGQLTPPSSMKAGFSSDKVYFECPDKNKGIVIGWQKKNVPQPNCYFQN